jgi:sec-independent protein translocase protein TatB
MRADPDRVRALPETRLKILQSTRESYRPPAMLSMPHLIVLFVVALVIFGPQKLPELARMLGKATAEFRKMTGDFRYALEEEVRELERQTRIREADAAAAAAQPQPSPVETAPIAPALVEPEGTVPRNLPPADAGAAGVAELPPHANPAQAAAAPDSATPPQEKPSDDNAAV